MDSYIKISLETHNLNANNPIYSIFDKIQCTVYIRGRSRLKIYMSRTIDGSEQSIDCAGQLMDPSIGHHLIDALLEWVIIHSIHRLAAI